MSAIEQCRSAALGGHALRCSACAEPQIAYNSCRNRHCAKCKSSAAQPWLEARQADLLPVEYYHVVFTLPAPISAIAYTNKEILYGLLFDVAAETLRTIAADPKHLGARIGTTLVLHTWGSALTHHPHVHGIVPGGGLAPDADRWVPCKPGFFLSVRVLSRLFRRRFLEELQSAHRAGQLKFFGEYVDLADAEVFADWLMPLRECEWVVYAKRPFAGPEAVLAYLSRYTHRVAISETTPSNAKLPRRPSSQRTDAISHSLDSTNAPHAHRYASRTCSSQRTSCRPALRHAHIFRRRSCPTRLPTRSNPHTPARRLTSSARSRGFLPRGLSNPCPSIDARLDSCAHAGSSRTILNNTGRPRPRSPRLLERGP